MTLKCRQLPGSLPSGVRGTSSGRLSLIMICSRICSMERICTLARSPSDSVTP